MKFSLIAFLIVACIIALAFWIDKNSNPPINRPLVTQSLLIYANGRIEGSSQEIGLRPQITDRIMKVLVSEGQIVNKNDILIQLDDQQYNKEMELAEAELKVVEAIYQARQSDVKLAELTWIRAQQMLAKKVMSRQEGDEKKIILEKLKHEVVAEQYHVVSASSSLELAKIRVKHTCLRAPDCIQIMKINGKVGEIAGPSSSLPALIVANITQYCVRAFVEELDAPRVKMGMIAKITADGMPNELNGKVIYVSPCMDNKQLFNDNPAERKDTKTREIIIQLQNDVPLIIGLRVDVIITP